MPTSLVTGGGGFIGSHLVDALVARGDKVRVLDNFSTGKLKNLQHNLDKIELITGDLRDSVILSKAVQGVDLIFHQQLLCQSLNPWKIQNPVLISMSMGRENYWPLPGRRMSSE